MSKAEILALSDEDLASQIKSLEPKTQERERDERGVLGVTRDAAKASKTLIPLRAEQNRRAEAKRKEAQNAKFDAETAERKANEARFAEQYRRFGGGI